MEVLVGPATYKTAAETAYVRDRTAAAGAAQDDSKKVVSGSCLFLKEEEEESGSDSSSSSSIGSDDDEVNDTNGDVSSSILSLDSLEDSLPIKRGLSSHFSGKSKSFTNLSEVSTVKDLVKLENPFNKRRRVLIANKLWSKKSSSSSSFYSWQNPKSMPLLTVHEDRDHNDDDDGDHDHDHHNNPVAEEEEEEEEKNQTRVFGNRLKKKIGFKSQSCFSLADLHEESEEYQ
ncbi:hypothetical protein LWI29_027399 [Acer saccharum]|uniref:Uncharacterized protein n=1 Tax=Acer saccharum TaxID=4024 RepID=A0AA39RH31_ACESA|nr:hypothetical protein LWI29_027399 [Acer saccharum]KAK1549432.1 hypothetical protein Q3G72_002042 [Acer saccharum]